MLYISIYKEIEAHGTKVATGLDWEVLVQYVVMMRCILASKRADYKGPFDIIPVRNECPEFRYIAVPGECKTINELIEYVGQQLKECTTPTLVMITSQYACFPIFDGFVWYHAPATSNTAGPTRKIIGYQCKLGNTGTSWIVPDSISKGVLIRGQPVDTSFNKKKWEFLDTQQITDFVGYSLQPLVPAKWPTIV